MTERFEKNVYVWFPSGKVERLSPTGGLFVHSSINPSGDSAVFWGAVNGRPRVWLSDFSSPPHSLTPSDVGAVEPVFDWQGERISYAADRGQTETAPGIETFREAWRSRSYAYGANFNLFVTNAEGTQEVRITDGPYRDGRPTFSPDGRTIAFLSNRSREQRSVLFQVAADGSTEPTPLVTDTWVGRPWFSADGEWIYFFTDVSGEHRICRVSAEGGQWYPISPEGLPRSHGTFVDADGNHLWFHSTVGSVTTIYRHNLIDGRTESMNPPNFNSAGHITRSRNGIATFDVTE